MANHKKATEVKEKKKVIKTPPKQGQKSPKKPPKVYANEKAAIYSIFLFFLQGLSWPIRRTIQMLLANKKLFMVVALAAFPVTQAQVTTPKTTTRIVQTTTTTLPETTTSSTTTQPPTQTTTTTTQQSTSTTPQGIALVPDQNGFVGNMTCSVICQECINTRCVTMETQGDYLVGTAFYLRKGWLNQLSGNYSRVCGGTNVNCGISGQPSGLVLFKYVEDEPLHRFRRAAVISTLPVPQTPPTLSTFSSYDRGTVTENFLSWYSSPLRIAASWVLMLLGWDFGGFIGLGTVVFSQGYIGALACELPSYLSTQVIGQQAQFWVYLTQDHCVQTQINNLPLTIDLGIQDLSTSLVPQGYYPMELQLSVDDSYGCVGNAGLTAQAVCSVYGEHCKKDNHYEGWSQGCFLNGIGSVCTCLNITASKDPLKNVHQFKRVGNPLVRSVLISYGNLTQEVDITRGIQMRNIQGLGNIEIDCRGSSFGDWTYTYLVKPTVEKVANPHVKICIDNGDFEREDLPYRTVLDGPVLRAADSLKWSDCEPTSCPFHINRNWESVYDNLMAQLTCHQGEVATVGEQLAITKLDIDSELSCRIAVKGIPTVAPELVNCKVSTQGKYTLVKDDYYKIVSSLTTKDYTTNDTACADFVSGPCTFSRSYFSNADREPVTVLCIEPTTVTVGSTQLTIPASTWAQAITHWGKRTFTYVHHVQASWGLGAFTWPALSGLKGSFNGISWFLGNFMGLGSKLITLLAIALGAYIFLGRMGAILVLILAGFVVFSYGAEVKLEKCKIDGSGKNCTMNVEGACQDSKAILQVVCAQEMHFNCSTVYVVAELTALKCSWTAREAWDKLSITECCEWDQTLSYVLAIEEGKNGYQLVGGTGIVRWTSVWFRFHLNPVRSVWASHYDIDLSNLDPGLTLILLLEGGASDEMLLKATAYDHAVRLGWMLDEQSLAITKTNYWENYPIPRLQSSCGIKCVKDKAGDKPMKYYYPTTKCKQCFYNDTCYSQIQMTPEDLKANQESYKQLHTNLKAAGKRVLYIIDPKMLPLPLKEMNVIIGKIKPVETTKWGTTTTSLILVENDNLPTKCSEN